MLRKCPSCGRLFQAKEIKRETLEAYEFREPGNRGGYIQGHAENFRVTFKCQSCCHEWTEVSEKPSTTTLNFLDFRQCIGSSKTSEAPYG